MNDIKNIIMINGSTLDRDTRITKIAKSLKNNGYSVTFLGWDQGFKHVRSEIEEAGKLDQEILLRLNAQWGAPVYLALPIWWIFVFLKLLSAKWDVAHAVQITSAFPAVIAGILKRRPVIYDLLDVYEDSIAIPIPIRNVLLMIDKSIMRLSTAVVLADEEEIYEVDGIPNSKIVVLYDSPSTIKEIDMDHKRNNVFTLFFAGLLIRKKALNLDKIFQAIESIDDIKIIIAGYGDLVDEIKEWENYYPDKIQFIGEISHARVLEMSSKADALFILRDPIVKVNKYICGSKILESMMCGRPIIVNKGTSTAKIVQEENCGLVVDAHSIDEIKNALIMLKNDRELCDRLGTNGKKAYQDSYSWRIMETRLVDLYESLK